MFQRDTTGVYEMKYKIYLVNILLYILALIAFSHTVSAQTIDTKYINGKTLCEYSNLDFPETQGDSISVYNAESGFVIYEKNNDKKIFPASTVKVMTAIIAYENIIDKSEKISISKSVVNESTGLKLGLEAGNTYTAEDLIRAVLISGSNDAANQLADYVSGENKTAFIKMMNDKAKEIGCTSTKFTNVTGLHDPNMYTTASDLLKIAIYAYQLGDLAEWSSSTSYSFKPLEDPDNYKLRYNRNDFISKSTTSQYYYKGAFGLNSGYTPEAGNCLITSAVKNGMTYICVVMNAPVTEDDETNYSYIDAKKILNFCFDNFTVRNVVDINSVISEVPLKLSANKDHVSLFPKNTVYHILPTKLSEDDLSYEKIIYSDEYYAPIKEGDEFGELIIKYKNDYIIGKTKLICHEGSQRSPVLFIIEKIKDFVTSTFFIVTMVTAVILFIIYTIITVRSRKKLFRYK